MYKPVNMCKWRDMAYSFRTLAPQRTSETGPPDRLPPGPSSILGFADSAAHHRERHAPNDRQPALDPGRPGGQAGLSGRRCCGE